MRFFTKKEDKFLKDNYLIIPAKRMSKMLGRSESVARQRMVLLGIVVPQEVIQKFKEDSYIKKGTVPPNKGKKQADYMCKEAIEKTKGTRFKTGQLPHNTKSDLDISIREDKRGVKYQFIRTGLSKWIPLHRHIWEKENGVIPKGLKLIFKDKNPMNCDLSNLELLTPAELMKINSYHNYPESIAKAIQLRGALNRQINKHIKKLSK